MPGPTPPTDPRLGNIPSNVLRNRQDKPVTVTSPALEWAAIQAAAITSPFGRRLYGWERDTVDDIFQGAVDTARIRIAEVRVLNAPTTLGNQIRVAPGWTFERDNRPVLVHECAHVWQYQTRGTAYITDSVYHNASGAIATGNRNVAYMNYRLQKNSSIGDFTAEEQATIVGDYYEMTRIYKNDPNPPSWVGMRSPDMAIYERLIGQVRSAMPRAETVIYENSLMNRPLPGVDPSSKQNQFAPTMPLLQFRF
ncbi:MAG TPA: hypothetical protein VGM82_09645 [Gemmatimonadaceae bacterium]|jgi:hypothetical protein